MLSLNKFKKHLFVGGLPKKCFKKPRKTRKKTPVFFSWEAWNLNTLLDSGTDNFV